VSHAQCSMAKLYCSEMAGRVADRAVQVFGGRGYMRENVAERFYRELRVERIWEGTSEIQRMIIAARWSSAPPPPSPSPARGPSQPQAPHLRRKVSIRIPAPGPCGEPERGRGRAARPVFRVDGAPYLLLSV
jgi:hypothetical protein